MKRLGVVGILCIIAILGSMSVGAAGVTGIVQAVDLTSKTVGVKDGKQVIVFDARNVQLKGYGSLGEVSRGDTVSVTYVARGLRITKLKGGHTGNPVPPRAARGKVRRLATGERGNSFDDTDENNDGRISPVELSTVIPGLTLKNFKEYDGNGDGYLNRREFEGLWKGP